MIRSSCEVTGDTGRFQRAAVVDLGTGEVSISEKPVPVLGSLCGAEMADRVLGLYERNRGFKGVVRVSSE
jgi:hypothetical protein